MGKKSSAQIRRLMRRAEARGETYEVKSDVQDEAIVPVVGGETSTAVKTPPYDAANDKTSEKSSKTNRDDVFLKYKSPALKLKKKLESIENDTSLRAKERRSERRKAEAIASEEAGCSAKELMDWYNEHEIELESEEICEDEKAVDDVEKKNHNPYIVFIGQISFKTTVEGLKKHLVHELGKEHDMTKEVFSIRLLTDPKTKKSRGMAFVEVQNPELLYACLKLHHTLLDGRRINVERSAGGKRNNEARKTKIKRFRDEQEKYVAAVVDKIIAEHKESGDLKDNELDDAVISLCKRHSANVVETAITTYIEKNGRDMDNPSAYLTFLIGKTAEENAISPLGEGQTDNRKEDKRNDKRTSKRPRTQ